MAHQFEIFGFQVHLAYSVTEALDAIGANEFDIVISDIRMPEATGDELLKALKSRDVRLPHVFMISGHSDFTLQEVFSLGADGLFPKPFNATTLREAIRRCLMAPAERWRKRVTLETTAELKCEWLDWNTAFSSGDLSIGRGGFYLRLKDKRFPPEGSHVRFNFDFSRSAGGSVGAIKNLSGVGYVHWVSYKPEGIGVEISYLEENCREDYVKWLLEQEIVSYIPSK